MKKQKNVEEIKSAAAAATTDPNQTTYLAA